ncbi:MAG: DUF1700 domain-containing protein [Bacteroidales bacterium]|nr:DUF1700 domain-containing protein [Clostridium sp.]MCM1203208.1 DUF1700 domain-containing protein [Bacteroidales bacterium]
MMKKEEFLAKLRKNLSVLEEGEIQDIIEEYEQHIDMKMKEGLSEEEAIHDFGDLKELTEGILEAYHVRKKAVGKATDAIGKGAGALGKSAETAGKWGVSQMKKLWSMLKRPFVQIKGKYPTDKRKPEGKGFWGKLWALVLAFCSLLGNGIVWSLHLIWNMFWLGFGILEGFITLGCVFLLGVLAVLLIMGYPFVGMTIVVIGIGLISSAVMLLCFTLIWKKKDKSDRGRSDGDFDERDLEEDWEYPANHGAEAKKITVNEYQEVLKHA